MREPNTMSEFLATLPEDSPIRDAHGRWSEIFDEVSPFSAMVTPNGNVEQMQELITATTVLRSMLEESAMAHYRVVKAFCGLLAADVELIKASA